MLCICEVGVSVNVRRYVPWGMDVPEGHAVITLLELQLLFKGQVHGLGTHGEHLVHQFIGTVILQAVIIVSGMERGSNSAGHSLPETEGGGSVPELVYLGFITGLDELIVNDQERVSRDVLWERREGGNSWHVRVVS